MPRTVASADGCGAIYRVVYQRRHGVPAGVRAMLDQESLAGVFAGARPTLAPDDLARAREVLFEVGDDPGYPTAGCGAAPTPRLVFRRVSGAQTPGRAAGASL